MSARCKGLFLLSISVLLSGCGGGGGTKVVYVVGEPFQSYVDSFVEAAYASGRVLSGGRLRIEFGDIDNPKSVGRCYYYESRVVMRRSFWESSSDVTKKILIFHELGHCLLFRKHDKTFLETGRPRSLMYPVVINSVTYMSFIEYYNMELFSKAGPRPLEVDREYDD